MTVLIISDEAEFARNVVNAWSTERGVPAFAVVNSAVWRDSSAEFDLAILSPHAARPELMHALNARGVAILCVVADLAAAQEVKNGFPRALVLIQHEGWLDSLILVGSEVLRRLEANARAARAEEAMNAASRHASLGRYMLEMRHSMNNALTSVLGHAELMLLESGTLPAEVRDQIETIHSMALRIHEILQRFSSLDSEMQFAGSQCVARAHAASR